MHVPRDPSGMAQGQPPSLPPTLPLTPLQGLEERSWRPQCVSPTPLHRIRRHIAVTATLWNEQDRALRRGDALNHRYKAGLVLTTAERQLAGPVLCMRSRVLGGSQGSWQTLIRAQREGGTWLRFLPSRASGVQNRVRLSGQFMDTWPCSPAMAFPVCQVSWNLTFWLPCLALLPLLAGAELRW